MRIEKKRVNALLDNASTKTDISTDVASELGLHGQSKRVTVNVLNGQIDTFTTKDVALQLESLDGSVNENISALTVDDITGNMETIDWNQYSSKWGHLKGINFPQIGSKTKIDILIGTDYAELQYSRKDVIGKTGEPVARLIPLG